MEVKNISNLISLEKMKVLMNESINGATTWGDFYVSLLEKVYNLGYEDGQTKRSQGEWMNRHIVYTDLTIATCSACGKRLAVGKYCSNCGANMEVKTNET